MVQTSSVQTAVAASVATAVTLVSIYSLWNLSHSSTTSKDRSVMSTSSKQTDPSSDCIYLDYNGTTPIYPPVLEAMLPYLKDHFGNPGSGHVYGDAPKAALQTARQQILRLLDETEGDVVFTGCGSEADHLGIRLALQKSEKPHIVTSNVEHPAILAYLRHLEATTALAVTYVPVQKDGCVRVADVQAAFRSNTVLVTIMLANNETGAVQPMREISKICRTRGVLCMTDAAQAAGKVSLKQLGCDMVVVVGHKIGAPKGVAALYLRNLPADRTPLGGGQEFGLRAGTENVPYIVGLGVAAHHALKSSAQASKMETLRHRLLMRLRDGLGEETLQVHGPEDRAERLPNTLSVAFLGLPHSGMLLEAVRNQVAASAGAACHANSTAVSSVLKAMDLPDEVARSTVRLSLGPHTTPSEIDKAAAVLVTHIKRQRRQERIVEPQI